MLYVALAVGRAGVGPFVAKAPSRFSFVRRGRVSGRVPLLLSIASRCTEGGEARNYEIMKALVMPGRS